MSLRHFALLRYIHLDEAQREFFWPMMLRPNLNPLRLGHGPFKMCEKVGGESP